MCGEINKMKMKSGKKFGSAIPCYSSGMHLNSIIYFMFYQRCSSGKRKRVSSILPCIPEKRIRISVNKITFVGVNDSVSFSGCGDAAHQRGSKCL